ncbi:MAG: hypothetical protein EXR21_09070 [Flavobacteriaceae bacterium]|nr:hypothetical protein [Flavobacteriaceae bacterium]
MSTIEVTLIIASISGVVIGAYVAYSNYKMRKEEMAMQRETQALQKDLVKQQIMLTTIQLEKA